MNYIYDIILNFQDNYYQFFEWRHKDKIKNIMKIPVYRVSNKDILILKNNKVKIDEVFLNKIRQDNKRDKKNMCLVSNTQITIGLLFDKNGTLLKRSSLIFEEEDEVNDYCKDLKITKINYLENIEIPSYNNLRLEKEKKETLIDYITNLTDISILKYLYYEYFKTECNSSIKIKKGLKIELEKEWTKKQKNLFYTIYLLNKNKLPMK